MDPISFDLEEHLRRHGGALRRLAHELLRDPAAVDDALQETWLRALRQPPGREQQASGWLLTILRHVAFRSRRGELRRVRREREVARSEVVGDHVEAIARTEITQRLLTAVNELDAPYRDTIWQRWFEGLPPRAIAARDRVPVATVKSRLQRGLQQLRARLGEEGETDWRAALAVAFGFGKAAVAAGTAAAWQGGVLMLTGTKVAAAAVVAIAAVWWWWPAEPVQPMAGIVASQPVDEVAATANEPDPVADRVALPAAPQPEPTLTRAAATAPAPDTTARLRGRVVAAETGAPLAGIEIYRRRGMGDVRWEPDDTLQATGPDGRFEFEVTASRTPGLMLRGRTRPLCYWTGASGSRVGS